MRLFNHKNAVFGILILIAALCIGCVASASVVDSGTCGENLTWTLDDEGLLTVSGTGQMDNYFYDWGPWGSGIQRVSIENGVTSIGAFSFYNCTNLISANIPNSVTSICDSAFRGCTNLMSVSIPNSVNSFGSYSFENCSSLTSITIPNSITNLGFYTFNGCTNLTSISFQARITDIDFHAFFSGCTKLASVSIPDDHRAYKSIDGVVFNKDASTILFYPYAKSGAYTIPNSVTNISSYAFSECTNLTSITIPNNITSMDWYAFSGCTGLTSVTIPSSLHSIAWNTFYGCSNLANVSIPSSVTSIGDRAFFGCALTRITLSANISEIGNDAFDKNKITIYAPEGSYAAQWAYNNYYNLVTTPREYTVNVYTYDGGTVSADYYSGVSGTVITLTATPDEGYQFKNWEVISGGVTIENNKFTIGTEDVEIRGDFASIHTITITTDGHGTASSSPSSGIEGTVVTLSARPDPGYRFKEWEVLNGYVFIENNKFIIEYSDVEIKAHFELLPDQVTISGGIYKLDYENKTASFTGMKKKNNKKLTIPNTVTANGEPYRVTEIAPNACKKNIKLQQLTIGANIEKIGANAFNGCSNLTKVTIKTTKLTKAGIGKNCFKGTGEGVTYKCPKKMKKNYKTWLTKVGKASKKATYK